MRKAAMLFSLMLLSAAVVLAQSTSSSPSNQPQAQTPPAQRQSTTNPQSPTTPVGSEPEQNSPAVNSNGQQPSTTPGQTTPAGDSNAPQIATTTNPQSISPAPNGADQAPANTEMHAALDTPLSTRTSRPGDRFTATVVDAVRGSDGAIIIPAGARVEGEVADTEQGKDIPALRGKGKLNLRFRDIVLPTGQTVPLAATLVSVNNTNGKHTKRTDEEARVQSGTAGKDVARDIGNGAGGGPVGGVIFGSPLKGLAIGTLAGGGYVLATKGKEVQLPAQTGMVIRLDQPVTVGGTASMQR